MTPNSKLHSLLATAAEAAAESDRAAARAAARIAWARAKVDALMDAQDRLTKAWDRILDDLPEELDDDELEAMDIPEPPEQAEVDAIYAEIRAVIDHDRWPKEMHWSL